LSLRLVLGLELRQVPLKRAGLQTSALRTSRRRTLCKKRATTHKRISFSPVVKVTEFTRCLDGGGTIPGDGSKVTLGLGKPHRQLTVPLAPGQGKGSTPIEERAWLPTYQRVRLLRAAMGDAKYFNTWQRHRRDWHYICKSRQESNADRQDQLLMPTSYAEACKRAKALARETSRWQRRRIVVVQRNGRKRRKAIFLRRHSHTANMKGKSMHSTCKARCKSKDKSRKAAFATELNKLGKAGQGPLLSRSATAPEREQFGAKCPADIAALGVGCHFCSRPIASGPPELRCTCLRHRVD